MEENPMARACSKYIQLLGAAVLVVLVGSPLQAAKKSYHITGLVTDTANRPIIGATVYLYTDSVSLYGCATDTAGNFSVRVSLASLDTLYLRVSSIGYERTTMPVVFAGGQDSLTFVIRLRPRLVEVEAVQVTPKQSAPTPFAYIKHKQLLAESQKSLIPTNPTSAIKEPQVIREGSNLSSKINVNGTHPTYYLNGTEIGVNPNHYGVFSIIPASVLGRMSFSLHGTSARYPTPSVVELKSGSPFEQGLNGEMSISLIEATGVFSVGTPRYFVLGSLRKSVLDKLVRQFDIHSDRRTLPPTNFQDVFVSAGLKMSPRDYLYWDQYHVRDYLSYSTGATAHNPGGVNTFLHTQEWFHSLRWEGKYDKVLVEASLAVKSGYEEYRAQPPVTMTSPGIELDLEVEKQVNIGKLDLTLPAGTGLLTVGGEVEYVSRSKIRLAQQNWNFQPPDANSDNPFLYQKELNQLYGSYEGQRQDIDNALYVSFEQSWKRLHWEGGVRWQQFHSLQESSQLLYRNRLSLSLSPSVRVGVFVGNYAEHPAAKILEPYQVLIHHDYSLLKPLRTDLTSVEFTVGGVEASLFAKRIRQVPAPTPDFEQVTPNGEVQEGFLTMRSVGELSFFGFSMAWKKKHFLSPRLDISTFYGYTQARKTVEGITVPYELNAPHKFHAQATYRAGQVVSFGSELNVRSGFSYTPSGWVLSYAEADRYSEDYYKRALSRENSERFPVNASLNVHVNFTFNDVELYATIANLTNHANPIINTSDGYIYDAGILPSIGFRWKFK